MARRYFTLAVLVMLASMALAQAPDTNTKGDTDGSGSPHFEIQGEIIGSGDNADALLKLQSGVVFDSPLFQNPPQGSLTVMAPQPQVEIPGGSASEIGSGPDSVAVANNMRAFVLAGIQAAWNRVDYFLNGPSEVEYPEHSGNYVPVYSHVMPLGVDLPAWATSNPGGRVVFQTFEEAGYPPGKWVAQGGDTELSGFFRTPGFGQQIGGVDAWGKGPKAFIEFFRIEPPLRGQGIYGPEAYAQWERTLPNSVKYIELESLPKAHNFWLDMGFKDTGRYNGMSSIMRKVINQ